MATQVGKMMDVAVAIVSRDVYGRAVRIFSKFGKLNGQFTVGMRMAVSTTADPVALRGAYGLVSPESDPLSLGRYFQVPEGSQLLCCFVRYRAKRRIWMAAAG